MIFDVLLKSCVITKFTQTNRVDTHLGTMLVARERQQASDNRNGKKSTELNFKGNTPGFEHVVFTYRKGTEQGNWKDNIQVLPGISACCTKYGKDHLARAIRIMAFPDKSKPSNPGANASTLKTKKYEEKVDKWVKTG